MTGLAYSATGLRVVCVVLYGFPLGPELLAIAVCMVTSPTEQEPDRLHQVQKPLSSLLATLDTYVFLWALTTGWPPGGVLPLSYLYNSHSYPKRQPFIDCLSLYNI